MTVRIGRLSGSRTGTQVQMTGASRVHEANLVDGSVTNPKLGAGAVTPDKTTGINSQAAADAHAALDLPSAHPAPTGPLDMNGQRLVNLADPVDLTDAASRAWAEDMLRNMVHQDPVLAQQAAPPGAPSLGDRYLVDAGGSGAWAGHDDEIAQWDGADWIYVAPEEGFTVSVVDTDELLLHNGSSWGHYGSRVDAAKLGGELPAYYAAQAALDAHAALDKGAAHPGEIEEGDLADGAVTPVKTTGIATDADLTAHVAADTGVHGVGGSTVESVSGAQAKVNAHANLTNNPHNVTLTQLGGLRQASGSYTGNGSNRTIGTSWQPRFVIIWRDDSVDSSRSGIIIGEPGNAFALGSALAEVGVDLTSTGFQLLPASSTLNQNGIGYSWRAFG